MIPRTGTSDDDRSAPPRSRPFLKMHGLRNHFVIVDGREHAYVPSPDEVQQVCDVEVGVGGDQLLVLEPPTLMGKVRGAYAFMRLFNPDGREAGACGNAARCVAYLLLEEGGLETLLLETASGVVECRSAGPLAATVEMGPITTHWEQIPTSQAVDTFHLDIESGPLRDALVVNIGTPHAVFFVEDLASVDVARFAPAIQANALFPIGVNVDVVEVVTESQLRLSTFERQGVLTAACGTGSCVAAYAARARGLTQANGLTVEMRGGSLQIELSERSTVMMTGPVAFSFSGIL